VKLVRGELSVEVRGSTVTIDLAGRALDLGDEDDLRWLAFVALPAAICEARKVPSEPASNVSSEPSEQIGGQTSIDEVLG
jgi:hypothetical protein